MATIQKEAKKPSFVFDLVMSEEAKETLNGLKATLQEINDVALNIKPARLQVKSILSGATFTFIQYVDEGTALFYDENGKFIILDLCDTKVII